MQEAEVVLSVLRERGRKGLPLTQLYRQMFNKDLYLLAYGNIYSNQGAMTPGVGAETADGMSEEKIGQMTQPDQEFIKDLSDIERYSIGSILSGGSSDPKEGNSLKAWTDLYDRLQLHTQKSRLKIPIPMPVAGSPRRRRRCAA